MNKAIIYRMSHLISRRGFLMSAGAFGAGLLMHGCAARSPHLNSSVFPSLEQQEHPVLAFATSMEDEFDYNCEVEGTLPPELSGTLYRNGPALFDRGGMRKRALFDGDGMVQSFSFLNGSVRYRNRFVRTRKFIDEETAGSFIYPTYSAQAPGGVFANIGGPGKILSQAGVNIFYRNGRLYAFDENNIPYELDPTSLATREPVLFGDDRSSSLMAAHPKIDGRTGEWLLFGLQYGRKFKAHVHCLDRFGKLLWRKEIALPRTVYVHDWFVTSRHVMFNLHPLEFDIWELLSGQVSVLDSLRWRGHKGNLIVITERSPDSEPRVFETDTMFMWHSVNAYEAGDTIIADYIGYNKPDHFMGMMPPPSAVMRGQVGTFESSGQLYRYQIHLRSGEVRERAFDHVGCEWPGMNPIFQGYPYRFCYLARSYDGEFFWSGISRIDVSTGRSVDFRFPEGMYCTEPVFVPLAGHSYILEAQDEPGWVLSEGHDGRTGRAFLAIFRTEKIEDGPAAMVWLEHHVPFSFHGYWHQQG